VDRNAHELYFPGALQHANAAAQNRDHWVTRHLDPGSAAHHFVLHCVREVKLALVRSHVMTRL